MAGTPTPPTERGAPDLDGARALYARHAEHYDVQTDWAGADRERVVDLLELSPGEAVLDVGCGTGLCFEAIRSRIGAGGRLVGVEPSIDMLGRAAERIARRRWANVDLRLGLAEEQLRPDDAFDAALFCFTHDVLRSPGALRAVVARLRPGGRVAAVGPMWAPWWAPAMNLLVWYVTSDYVTTFEGFSEPWSHLGALVPALEVERHDLAGQYFAWGRIGG
ncbi:MAG TPA: methyltransferase domain-containing protein [Acidimicrobiia bacterium]|nr:methyltransferase domain-containing protein [Acidimicrobiia bacterium]